MKIKHKLLVLMSACLLVATGSYASLTALDSNGDTWNFVGSWQITDGPSADNGATPPVYSGLQAANLIWGTPSVGHVYAISTSSNSVTHTAYLNGFGGDTSLLSGAGAAEGFSQGVLYTYDLPNNIWAFSAYVHDKNYNAVNYAWERSVAVPETSTLLSGALLLIPFALGAMRKLRNTSIAMATTEV